MAVSKKGSRKIIVEEHEFRWRATGNDGWISVVIWPIENDNSRLVGTLKYHSNTTLNTNGSQTALDQIIVTNRMVREIIQYFGVNKILLNKGQINIGSIEDIYDMSKAVRGNYRAINT